MSYVNYILNIVRHWYLTLPCNSICYNCSRQILFKKEEIVNDKKDTVYDGITQRLYADEEIIIGATDGKETISRAIDVFWFIDDDFQHWGLDLPGDPTPPTLTDIRELAENGSSPKVYKSLGDLDRLYVQQSQVKKFCRELFSKLRTEGCDTLFLLKKGKDGVLRDRSNLYLASVNMHETNNDVKLMIFAHRFLFDGERDAKFKHRYVVPKL
jgi:hypothetical protein